ncbi:MAG: AbrB/MazE/SpoVT family DNA-binding domain-containing protein [Chloroflexi bacterium]|nr:AbrB/MazE/SpoVT family DNA-binding domain-containing protein [Chloroflexota bacterium]
MIEAVLRRLGRPATRAELYDTLKTEEGLFDNRRRLDATIRDDLKRPRSVFVRQGKDHIALRNPTGNTTQLESEPQESKVYERGQTVVPKRIRDAMAVEEGTTLMWQVKEGIAQVVAIPKDPVRALYGIMKEKGPTFQEYLAERNAERQRERELEADD